MAFDPANHTDDIVKADLYSQGIIVCPVSSGSPHGWGKPFHTPEGDPINPPLGTAQASKSRAGDRLVPSNRKTNIPPLRLAGRNRQTYTANITVWTDNDFVSFDGPPSCYSYYLPGYGAMERYMFPTECAGRDIVAKGGKSFSAPFTVMCARVRRKVPHQEGRIYAFGCDRDTLTFYVGYTANKGKDWTITGTASFDDLNLSGYQYFNDYENHPGLYVFAALPMFNSDCSKLCVLMRDVSDTHRDAPGPDEDPHNYYERIIYQSAEVAVADGVIVPTLTEIVDPLSTVYMPGPLTADDRSPKPYGYVRIVDTNTDSPGSPPTINVTKFTSRQIYAQTNNPDKGPFDEHTQSKTTLMVYYDADDNVQQAYVEGDALIYNPYATASVIEAAGSWYVDTAHPEPTDCPMLMEWNISHHIEGSSTVWVPDPAVTNAAFDTFYNATVGVKNYTVGRAEVERDIRKRDLCYESARLVLPVSYLQGYVDILTMPPYLNPSQQLAVLRSGSAKLPPVSPPASHVFEDMEIYYGTQKLATLTDVPFVSFIGSSNYDNALNHGNLATGTMRSMYGLAHPRFQCAMVSFIYSLPTGSHQTFTLTGSTHGDLEEITGVSSGAPDDSLVHFVAINPV